MLVVRGCRFFVQGLSLACLVGLLLFAKSFLLAWAAAFREVGFI